MKIYTEAPMWLALYTGDPLADGIALPDTPRILVETWELLSGTVAAQNTDTLRLHPRVSDLVVTHGALFAQETAEFPLPNLVHALPGPFAVVPRRDLVVRPGDLVVTFVPAGSSRAFGRGPFGVSQFSRWPEDGYTAGIVRLVLDTLFDAVPLACGGQWPVVVAGRSSSHAP
jgi:hypothetical protein